MQMFFLNSILNRLNFLYFKQQKLQMFFNNMGIIKNDYYNN